MTAAALSCLLVDFGSAVAPMPCADDDAYRKGHTDATEEARAEWAARAEAMEAAFEERLAAARAEWAEDEGARLADGIAAAVTELEDRIGNQAADVLAPFLEGAALERALEGLATAVRRLSGQDGPPILRIDGPRDLVDALRRRLGKRRGPKISLEIDQTTTEVTLTVGDTRLKTAIGAWRHVIARALDGRADQP